MASRFAAVILGTVILLTGCNNSSGYDVEVHKEEQETDYSQVYAEIIEFDGFKDAEFLSQVNMSVGDDVRDAIHKFDALAQESDLPDGVKAALRITQSLKRNKGCIVSFVSEQYIYTGGAHGTASWYPKTIYSDSESSYMLTLPQLFDSDEYIDIINSQIDEIVEKNPDIYQELWAEPHISKETEDRFYLTDTELVIYFPPYELSYYAKGFVEFKIPLQNINSVLKEQFRDSKK